MGMLNGLSQVVSVTWFNLATLPQRLGSSATAVFGIAGVVAVMVGVLPSPKGSCAPCRTPRRPRT